jgi:hypothetical protein
MLSTMMPTVVTGIGGIRVGVVATIDPVQRAALVDLYIATDGSMWNVDTGWRDYASGSDPCGIPVGWSGVKCSRRDV